MYVFLIICLFLLISKPRFVERQHKQLYLAACKLLIFVCLICYSLVRVRLNVDVFAQRLINICPSFSFKLRNVLKNVLFLLFLSLEANVLISYCTSLGGMHDTCDFDLHVCECFSNIY